MTDRNNLNLTARACPACRKVPSRVAQACVGYDVVACSGCDFVYLPVAIDSQNYVEGELAWENANNIKQAQRRAKTPLRTRLDMATRFRTKFAKKTPADYLRRAVGPTQGRPRVLDIGCGAGAYLAGLAASYTPFGIEISTGLAATAREVFSKSGGDVLAMSSLDGLQHFEPGSMDAVVLRSYLEHESEPRPLLDGCARVLRKGGHVVIKVPNYASFNRRIMGARWCGFRYPEHVNYFTPASLRAMAKAAGFSMRQSFLDAAPTSDNMWCVLTKD